MNVVKTLKKIARSKSPRHKRWNMNKVKRLVNCPNCGIKSLLYFEDVKLSPTEAKKLEKIINLLKSHKDPYKKKFELFNLLKKLETGELEPSEERRTEILFQGKIYNELAKQSLREYKKLIAKDFSKSE
jgi:hypothetical protein